MPITTVKCGKCGGEMSLNPHPSAGNPDLFIEVGCQFECIPCLVKGRHELAVRVSNLENALRTDATDLWGVTNAIKKEIQSREWILEGRGCYAWDDNRYKDEARLAFEAVLEILNKVQYPAQLRFNAVIK